MAQAADLVLTATVLPDVSGLDKSFDYLVPEALVGSVTVGSMVRVPLHGRRVGGWVVRVGPPDPGVAQERLLPIAAWTGHGPGPDVIELAEWAAHRWAAGRLRPLLATASPHVRVRSLVGGRAPRRPRPVEPPAGLGRLLADGGGVMRVAPTSDPADLLDGVALDGQLLVVHPSVDGARALADRLRRAGRSVALLPADWGVAAAGSVEVVVGGRSAVWATLPGLAAVVVLDEHDEALQEERTPTWHARDVAIERARRASVPCALVSPAPTVAALQWSGRRWMRPAPADELAGWPQLEIVDRRSEEPWKRSLLSGDLLQWARRRDLRVVCVHNVPGRARLLACRACRALLRCEHCEGAVAQGADTVLTCRRCGLTRPPVCQQCGSSALASVKPGVARLREELEAAAGRPVVAVAADSGDGWVGGTADLLIGTEAVLHRARNADLVAFLDFDAELLAPRYRAGEQAMALLVRAARLVGPRAGGGRVLVQTTMPDHEVLRAALAADPGMFAKVDAAGRRALGLPPFGALAHISGPGAESFCARLGGGVAPDADGFLVRAPSWEALADRLASVPRPAERMRIDVDPPRR